MKEFRLEDEYHYNRQGPVRWILSHLLRYPHLPLAVVVASLLNNLAFSYVQLLIGRAFDLITQPEWEISALFAVAAVVFGAAVGQGIVGLARNFSNEFIAGRVERDSRDELYVSLLGKSQTFHGKQRIGDIMARATNDVRSLNLMFSPGLMLLVDSLMGIVTPLFLIGTVKAELLLVPGIFLLLFTITVSDYARRLKPVSMSLRERFGIMNAGLAEAISGIEVVKGSAQELQEQRKFMGDAGLYRDFFIEQGLLQARYFPLLMFFITRAFGLFHALWLWREGIVTLGEVVAFMGLFSVLRFPTFISLFSFDLVQMGIASARRILELVNTESNVDENEEGVARPIQGEVRFENVSFAYDGSQVLKDISFTARPGETVAIVGQTGSGKTTLTRLINRIFDADEGRVLVDGVDVREWSLESLRSQISTIEQDIFLFSRSLADNIAFGCDNSTQEAIVQAAKEAQAHDFITGFSDGYETDVGERGVTLSGGQRQRIAIARAFLTNPCILILDDSTSAIDSATEDQIQKAMRRISSQRTTFLITHRLSQIRWADRILVLRQGMLVDQGTHEELLARSEPYQRIFARYD